MKSSEKPDNCTSEYLGHWNTSILQVFSLNLNFYSEFYLQQQRAAEGLYKIIYQILQQNSCELNSKSVSDMIR